MLRDFLIPGRASFIVGGQFGSEAKGAAAAWVAAELQRPPVLGEPMSRKSGRFDIVTTNAGAQAGHTSIHACVKRVVYHLPTAPLIAPGSIVYLNAGSIIDLDVLTKEIDVHWRLLTDGGQIGNIAIHPNAAIITSDCRDAEGRADSAQTKIASTRKGVGAALAHKVLRSGITAEMAMPGSRMITRLDLNVALRNGKSVLVEVPQGFGLSLNGPFYPHCTSRDCGVGQAMNDAGIHPSFVGPVMVVLRTFPIRVGNINDVIVGASGGESFKEVSLGTSGGCYPDQYEISWAELGVKPEITTVTKRVRRVFTWSHQQVREAFEALRPTHVFLSHVDYLAAHATRKLPMDATPYGLQGYGMSILNAAREAGLPPPQVFYSTGPTTGDVQEWLP